MNPSGVHRTRSEYNAVNDPHLYDFFVRKFVAMDPLQPARTKTRVIKWNLLVLSEAI